MISLARKTLIYEWRRFIPVGLSVGFAGVLLIVQTALVLGIFGSAAIYIKASSADVWVGYPGTQSVNYGRMIDADVKMRLQMDPAIGQVESYQWVDGEWYSPNTEGGSVSVYLSGISTQPQALMFSKLLPEDLRAKLREPGAVIVDPADLNTLGSKLGERAWINQQPVRIVGLLKGLRGLGGVNILSSKESALQIAGLANSEASTYYLARLKQPEQLPELLTRFSQPDKRFGRYEMWSADDFALRSQRYWLLDTGAGVAVLFMAGLVCLVGVMITSQALKTVINSYSREYATLNALGASRRSLAWVVIEQSLWIGAAGLSFAAVVSTLLLNIAKHYQVPVAMTPIAAVACVLLIIVMVLLSSLSAMRSQLRVDPSLLLR
ncbi:ABC transporter permease [Acinetobacter rudis]|uniref:ABC transporter permease n=1 Tax=Acinetobacter rudis TaxID=632955 RepID=UPI002810099D|nr:ABC transporter permease [Acinetobacter rudis]MDQ8951754.1 ABC transporter permease [Acinetobacter rudis]